jgi:hypothetical protein
MPRETTDVLIAGGGFAGLTLAIALRQALGPSFAVTVADPALGVSHADDERASAIVAAARRLFETLGVWDAVSARAQPILDMVVTDSRLDDAMRPVFLTFAGEVEPGEPFAHMIENRFLVAALATKAKEIGIEFQTTAARKSPHPDRLTAVDPPPPGEGGSHRLASHNISMSSLPTAGKFSRAFSLPPMARVRKSARAPASPPTGGLTISRRS